MAEEVRKREKTCIVAVKLTWTNLNCFHLVVSHLLDGVLLLLPRQPVLEVLRHRRVQPRGVELVAAAARGLWEHVDGEGLVVAHHGVQRKVWEGRERTHCFSMNLFVCSNIFLERQCTCLFWLRLILKILILPQLEYCTLVQDNSIDLRLFYCLKRAMWTYSRNTLYICQF